jgi:NO-binding membrane sensor protein with MHYT domain
MLAASFPSAVDYLVLPTLLSFLICVLVVGAGVYAAHASGPPALRVGLGAVGMGLGISLMHYVGMSAVHLVGPTSQEPPYVAASIVISIGASGLALCALDTQSTKLRLLVASLGLGLAISGMHYMAMAGMRLDPRCFDVSQFVGAESSLSRNTLALLSTFVAFGVSGAFLLSLVPDSPKQPTATQRFVGAVAAVDGLPILPRPPSALPEQEGASTTPLAAFAKMVRVEKDGHWLGISLDDIFAVRANAHYTYVFDGEREYFCNLSIGALEARLDPRLFLRVHRSHIVAVGRITRVKKAGENGVAELGAPVRCSIPIARANIRQVKQRLAALTG